MSISKAPLGGVVAAAVIVLAGCGGPGSSDTHTAPATGQPSASSRPSHSMAHTGSSPQAEKASITIDNFAYQVPDQVAPGATVTVTNKDTTTHTVTSDKGDSFNITVPGGDTATFTAPDKPGDYAFGCKFHANMHGTLVVKK